MEYSIEIRDKIVVGPARKYVIKLYPPQKQFPTLVPAYKEMDVSNLNFLSRTWFNPASIIYKAQVIQEYLPLGRE